jgi:glycosyltransferase involved in cell wall biosynthesis
VDAREDTYDPSACSGRNVAILIPLFNDWESLMILLPQLDSAVEAASMRGNVFVVDDGSTVALPDGLRNQRYRRLTCVTIVRLRCNIGHQRAIAVGLARPELYAPGLDAVVIMDGDGEDSPADIPRLISELMKSPALSVVFAARTRRLEAPAFRFMYHVFRIAHKLLTGIAVRVGNFSALRPSAANRLLLSPHLWNHYAAAVFRSRIPFSTVRLARGRRYKGHSHMDYSSLVAHGLSAIAVFSDVVGARLIMATAALIVVLSTLLLAVLIIRFYTSLAIPGWATSAGGLLVVLVAQAFLLLLIVMFIVLGNRSRIMFLPLRDSGIYVESIESLS